jgi:hypothetical protein
LTRIGPQSSMMVSDAHVEHLVEDQDVQFHAVGAHRPAI